MTLGEVIRKADEVQQNNFSREDKIRWLRQLDGEIWEEVILTHEGWENVPTPKYDEETPDNTVLIVAEPYEGLYISWLQMKMDALLSEYDLYNNHNAEFQTALAAYKAWYNRTHMPIGVRGRYW